MDTIGDFLTIIRNANRIKKDWCKVGASNLLKAIALVLKKTGYIANFDEKVEQSGLKTLLIRLKYIKGVPVVNELKRCSTPGARWYVKSNKVPKVLNGLGMCVLSTSKGIITGNEARENHIGGELLFKIW